jgi:HSP20 family protein
MFYRSMFPRDLYAELNQLQRAAQQAFDLGPNIRGAGAGYPAVNVGRTPESVDIYVFAPGMDASEFDVRLEKGTLSVAGERKVPALPEKSTMQIDQRFAGKFRRVISLPDDADVQHISAKYQDGVLHISVPRVAASQPRRITIH